MKPKPWSFSALETFTTCPRQYYEKQVSKSVKEDFSGPHLDWGRKVHSHFEERQKYGLALPPELEKHESYMEDLGATPGIRRTERKMAFNKSLRPTDYFANDVWTRGVIDFSATTRELGRVVDYKTGKKRDKPKQLALMTLYLFMEQPALQKVDAEFYWVDIEGEPENRVSRRTWTRRDMPGLWQMFLPDLKQYVEAFQTDTWQTRQSGLCHGWCPVSNCELWRPKK